MPHQDFNRTIRLAFGLPGDAILFEYAIERKWLTRQNQQKPLARRHSLQRVHGLHQRLGRLHAACVNYFTGFGLCHFLYHFQFHFQFSDLASA